jgi:hypothetical protein
LELAKFDSVWARGRAMRMDHAIELALEMTPEVTNE